ncbi:MAG TPA: glycosyltransferase [Candidatus Thermoplasmatota archaeon]|nr:glycosyltransferase [Candidatus Thermoplasmatota archaeon]
MRVAVVIVSKNDPRLDACLESVYAQKPPFEFDVVVVDNASRPEFHDALAKKWTAKPNFRTQIIPGNFSAAWNVGAFATGAEVLARLDSDTIAHEAWLERLVHPLLEETGIAWTAGAVVGPTPLRSLTQRYFHHRTLGYEERLRGETLPTSAVPSWNVAYRRDALMDVGGYDPWQKSSIDWDLHKRLADRGHEGRYVPDALVTHDHPARLRDFYRKEAWYRTGQYQMMLKYGPKAIRESLALPATYLALAGLAVLGVVDARITYVAAVGFFFLLFKQWLTARMEHDAVWWARPFYRVVEATAALHGLVRGLLRFGVRRRPIPRPA